MGHTVALDTVDGRVGLTSRTVVLRCVDMDYERLACDLLGVYAGRIGEPVVAMDDVEIKSAGYHSGCNGVIVDFFENIVGVAA